MAPRLLIRYLFWPLSLKRMDGFHMLKNIDLNVECVHCMRLATTFYDLNCLVCVVAIVSKCLVCAHSTQIVASV